MVDWTGIAAVIAPVSTLLGGLGGYWLAGRNDEARDRRAAERETAARRAALAERLEEERHTFQRDTLLQLQDELQRLARSATLVLLQDEKTLKEQGQLFLLPAGLGGEETLQIYVSVHRLRERILDYELRASILEFIDLCHEGGTGARGKPREEAIAAVRRQNDLLGHRYAALSEQLGEHLRRELDRQFPR